MHLKPSPTMKTQECSLTGASLLFLLKKHHGSPRPLASKQAPTGDRYLGLHHCPDGTISLLPSTWELVEGKVHTSQLLQKVLAGETSEEGQQSLHISCTCSTHSGHEASLHTRGTALEKAAIQKICWQVSQAINHRLHLASLHVVAVHGAGAYLLALPCSHNDTRIAPAQWVLATAHHISCPVLNCPGLCAKCGLKLVNCYSDHAFMCSNGPRRIMHHDSSDLQKAATSPVIKPTFLAPLLHIVVLCIVSLASQ